MEWARGMACRLSQARNGEKDRVIACYQAMTGKSSQTLYRIAKKHGYCCERKARADKGELRSGVTRQQLQMISSLIQTTAREVKGTILPATEALDMAIDNEILEPGQISASRLQALLREYEMGKAALNAEAPCIRMASLHPNHVHVFDASICIQYYLKGGKGLRIMDARDFREKKPANLEKVKKERLLRMILTDHFSHWMFVKYYLAAGENQQITYDFLTSAWRGGIHEKLPFRGVPFFLLMDAGSANIAKGIMGFINNLGIETPPNMVHNPRRQGSAECAQNIWETHFEARLRLEPAATVEQLNDWTIDYMVRWNGTKKHKRHGMARTDCWLKFIRKEHLRDLPTDEILQDAYAEPEVERTVTTENKVGFKGETYRVKHIAGIRPGLKVMLVKRPLLWPQMVVRFNDVEYVVNPVGKMAGGFAADAQVIGQGYKSQPETIVQKNRKENENLAYGEEKKKGDLPFGGTLHVFGNHAEKVVAVPMPRRGIPIETGRDIVAKEISIIELLSRLRAEVGQVSPELNRELREEFGQSVAVKTAEAVIAAIAAGEEWKGQRPEDRDQRSVRA